ncbi:MAG: protein of unknown function DUF3127 [Siphoviridae sp. ctjeG17]|nr:MAG: protein of unknown function DUF3127 [Siphoviridae sp. ctjeG17]
MEKGKITKVSDATVGTDKKKVTYYVINEKSYSTFKYHDFKEGDEVEFEFKVNGNYFNILTMSGPEHSKEKAIRVREVFKCFESVTVDELEKNLNQKSAELYDSGCMSIKWSQFTATAKGYLVVLVGYK